jgi:hypothetical protein
MQKQEQPAYLLLLPEQLCLGGHLLLLLDLTLVILQVCASPGRLLLCCCCEVVRCGPLRLGEQLIEQVVHAHAWGVL